MKNYLIIQILATIFLVFAVIKVFRKYKDKNINIKELIFWLIIWLITGVVFWLPQTTSIIANLLGIGRGADLVIYISIILIFYLIFRIYVVLDRQQQEITKIVRNIAINEADKQSDKQNHD